MWPTFVNLLARAWESVLGALSTSTLGIILLSIASPIVVFIITIVAVSKMHPEEDWVKHLRDAFVPTAIGIAVPLVLISGLFVWKIVSTVYTEHVSLSDKYHDAIKPQCWMSNLGMKPPGALPVGMKSANTVVFWCNADHKAPLSIEWNFNIAPKQVSTPMFPDILVINANIVFQGSKAVSYVERPSLRKFQPTAITLYSDMQLAPQATSIVIRTAEKDDKSAMVTIEASDLRDIKEFK
jgi:hypothetical protein